MFKPTDRVQVRENFNAPAELGGREGVVIRVEEEPPYGVLVRFPGWTDGHSGCYNSQSEPRGSKESWWLLETDLRRTMNITVGRIVHYVLTTKDAEQITRQRTIFVDDKWPVSLQTHVGNEAQPGDVLPMLVVHVEPEPRFDGHDIISVNGQVFLDGNDVLWVTSIKENIPPTPGSWHWPPRE